MSEIKSGAERRIAHENRVRELESARDGIVAALEREASSAKADCERDCAAANEACQREVEAVRAKHAMAFMPRTKKNAAVAEANERFGAANQARVRKLESERDARLSVIDTKTKQAHANCARDAKASADALTAANEKIAAKLIADWYGAMTPRIKAWENAPTNAEAENIGRLFWDFDLRARHELGQPLHSALLACAFCDVLLKTYPHAVRVFGEGFAAFAIQLRDFRASLEDEPVQMKRALMALTDELEVRASKAAELPSGDLARMTARYAVNRACPTDTWSREKLEAFDLEAAAERKRDFVANYKPPQNEPASGVRFSQVPCRS